MKTITTIKNSVPVFRKLIALAIICGASLFSSVLKAQPSVVPQWDSIKMWSWFPGQDWMLSDRKTSLVYDAQHNLLSYSGETSNPPSTNVNKTRVINSYDANNNKIASSLQIYFGSSWITYIYDTSTFDANNNMTSDLYQMMNGTLTAMITQRHSISTYDAHSNRLSLLDSSWTGSSFSISKIDNAYDTDDNMTWDLEQSWDGTAWTIYTDRSTTYDLHHNKITVVDSIWASGSVQTVSRNRYTNTYDVNNNLTSTVDSVSSAKTVYTYDLNNNRLSATTQNWNGTAFVTTHALGYTFDANSNLTSQVDSVFHWSGGTSFPILQSISRSFFTYDANNNQTSDLSQNWGGGSVYKDVTKKTYTYDTDNNKYIVVRKNYDNAGTTVTTGDSTYFYGSGATTTGLRTIASVNTSLSIYPNPANSELHIFSDKVIEKSEIYDLTGKLQLTTGKSVIDVSTLPPGVYFVKLYFENGSAVQKFIRQ